MGGSSVRPRHHVDPRGSCQVHLLQRHYESHRAYGSVCKALDPDHPRRVQHYRSLEGLVRGGVLDVDLIKQTHDEVAEEMVRRGMNHKSPMAEITGWTGSHGRVNPWRERRTIWNQCEACASREG